MLYALIMAGGKGERFWPLSRTGRPKQLLSITNQDKTMLEETIDRIKGFIPKEQVRIITGSNIKEKIHQLMPELDESHLLTEPFGRNTCLAIAYSALLLEKEDPDATMIVLSSDHMIKPREKLIQHLKIAADLCHDHDYLLTLGITPTRPETGYGYIEIGDVFKRNNGINTYKVSEFKEKPSRIVAQQYYYGRRHLWNSGMFVWSVKSILNAVMQYQPEMWDQLMKYKKKIGTADEENAKKELYRSAENISIDVAILEKADNVLTVKADMIWDDVGSWLSLDRITTRDQENNVVVGETVNSDSYENIIYNDSDGIISTLGVSDLIIVKTGDIVMVAQKTKVNDLKALLRKLSENDKYEKYL